jgi:acyl-CoA thioester hydrolase
MDTAVNDWMIRHGGLDPRGGGPIAVCASSSCEYREAASFPESLEVGIAVERLGASSVTWSLGILRAPAADAASDEPIAVGRFVHVFVDSGSRRPTPVPDGMRAAIERLFS